MTTKKLKKSLIAAKPASAGDIEEAARSLTSSNAQDTAAAFAAVRDRIIQLHAVGTLEAVAAQNKARRELIIAAADLLPTATALAKKGKPRLLAVLTKIINDRNVKFGGPR